jgi:Lanthionine synthetase C-like protein
MAISDEIFHSYVTAWAGAIRGVRYQQLRQLQPAPHATIAHGGAGTAFALWRLGRRGAAARSWAAAARADRRASACLTAAGTPSPGYLGGRAGIAMVQALTSPADRARAVARYMRFVRDDRSGSLELFAGSAGLLVGACAMLGQFDDARLDRQAAQIADVLSERARVRAREGWHAIDTTNFAHRWIGVLYALLCWSELGGAPPAPWLVDALADLARLWRPELVPYPHMRGSWCTGAAGAAMLWAKAYERCGEAIFLRTAGTAARAAAKLIDPTRVHLCCGLGGVAYALLALDRVDPDRGWRDRARSVGARAVTTPLATAHPNGLLWGHPGLVCLALDLLADKPRGFPCIEA